MAKIILDIKQDKKETFIKMINSIIVDRNCEIKLFQAPSKIDHHDEIHVLLKDNVDPFIPFLIGVQYTNFLKIAL